MHGSVGARPGIRNRAAAPGTRAIPFRGDAWRVIVDAPGRGVVSSGSMQTLNILGICGSFRLKSYNMMALRTAGALMLPGMSFRVVSYDDIPLYSQDLQDRGFPAPVLRLKADIEAADGILFASPEYNHSVAGVLKNAIDWLSRFPDQPFKFKPVAVLSATQGPLGGARNQYELRKIMNCLEAIPLARPEIFIGNVQTKFDGEGRLTDESTRKIMTEQMTAFRGWILRLQKGAA